MMEKGVGSSARASMFENKRKPFRFSRHAILFSAILICAVMVSSQFLLSTAMAATPITVTVNSGTVVGQNSLSLGFMLDHEWQTWLNSATEIGLADQAGFKLVRIFDWRSTSPQPCRYWYESTKTGQWDWTTVDSLIDKIFAIGAEPLICLGGTNFATGAPLIPSGMAVNPSTGLPYPESFAAYAKAWVTHFAQRGKAIRFYEIFNEPAHYFGYGVNAQKLDYYIAVWNAAARAMRQVKSGLMLSQDHITLRKVLDAWLTKGDAVDYIDFHKYDSDGLNKYTDATMFARVEMLKFETDTTFYGAVAAQQKWLAARGKQLPILLTESNFNSYYNAGTDPKIQQMAGTVWLSLILRKSILSGLSYYTYYSFCSTAKSGSTGQGFGMVDSANNKPWYPYYLQSLIGNNLAVGDSLVASTSSSSEMATLAWLHNNKLNILLICEAGSERTVYLNGVGGQLTVSKLDNTVSWTTARIQNTTIYSTNSMTFNGYTVALLQTQAEAPVVTLFADGFESGNFGAWTGTTAPTGTASVTSTLRYNGIYSAQFTVHSATSMRRAYSYKNTDALSKLHASAYVYIADGLPVTSGQSIWLIRFVNSGGSALASFGIRADSSGTRWAVQDSAYPQAMGTSGPAEGRWYLLEAYYTQASSGKTIVLTVDGVEVASLSQNTSGDNSITSVFFGIAYCSSYLAAAVRVDDVKISN